ncbi:hypothetical protein AAC387_Pa02g0152 [Persea americana]
MILLAKNCIQSCATSQIPLEGRKVTTNLFCNTHSFGVAAEAVRVDLNKKAWSFLKRNGPKTFDSLAIPTQDNCYTAVMAHALKHEMRKHNSMVVAIDASHFEAIRKYWDCDLPPGCVVDTIIQGTWRPRACW